MDNGCHEQPSDSCKLQLLTTTSHLLSSCLDIFLSHWRQLKKIYEVDLMPIESNVLSCQLMTLQ